MATDLILFLGQSNMVGQTERLAESEAVPGASEYRYLTDELIPLRDPAGEDVGHGMLPVRPLSRQPSFGQWLEDTVLHGAVEGHTTLIPSFARGYIEATGHEIIAVPAAKGSTTAADWQPGTEGCAAVIKKARAAVKRAGRVDNVYAVWLQGESDMLIRTDPDVYIERVIRLKDVLKAELGLSRFGVIRVGRFFSLGPFNDIPAEERLRADMAIIRAQDAMCERDADLLMLTRAADALITGDPRYVNPGATGHFSATGLQLLGREAGLSLGSAVR